MEITLSLNLGIILSIGFHGTCQGAGQKYYYLVQLKTTSNYLDLFLRRAISFNTF